MDEKEAIEARLLTVEVVTDAVIRVLVKKNLVTRKDLQDEILEGAKEEPAEEAEEAEGVEQEDDDDSS